MLGDVSHHHGTMTDMAADVTPLDASPELVRDVAFVFPLDPTVAQAHELARWAGVSRFVFNQGLALSRQRQDARRWLERQFTPDVAKQVRGLASRNALIPAFNTWKSSEQSKGRRLWLDDVSKFVREEALVDVATAYKNWFESLSGIRAGQRARPPRFKKKGRAVESFRLRQPSGGNGTTSGIRFAPATDDGSSARAVWLPGGLGWAKLAQNPRKVRRMVEKGRFKIAGATVSYRHGRWQVSVYGKAAAFHPARQERAKDATTRGRARVGVDLGVRTQATVADEHGQVILEQPGVKALDTQLRKLRRASRAYARTKRRSKGRQRAARRLARIHTRVVGLRRNALHQLTSELATTQSSVTIEDLDVAAMLRSGRGARGVADQTFGEFRRQLSYKADWYGTELVVADRWFASSKTCSACGHVHRELPRGAARWACPACGVVHDRDVNAAVNLARWEPEQQPAKAA